MIRIGVYVVCSFLSLVLNLNYDKTLQFRTSLNTDDIISLLNFTLSNDYFVINNCIYKQIHVCAMGGQVRPIVAITFAWK